MVFVRRKSTRLIKKPELYIPEDTVLEDGESLKDFIDDDESEEEDA
jgi:hypothetical protein